jgi:hypothetical protein
MAEGFTTYKKREWWREDGEVSESERRMKEGSDNRKKEFELKAGSDGKNVPSITTKYSAKAGRKKVAEKKLTVKKYVEAEFDDEDEFEDDDMVADMDDDMGVDMDDEVGINDEMDVPAEAEMSAEGGVCTCPACGAKLVIEAVPEDEEAMSDEDDMEDMDDMGDEGMEDMDSGMDVESEEDDMTVPKLENKKDKFNRYMKKMESKKKMESEESFEEAYKKWKEERKRRIESLKNKKRKVEAESEIGVQYGTSTAKMVGSGKTFDGNKTDVGAGNDDDVGITSSSTSDMVGGGKTFAGTKSSISGSGSRSVESDKTKKKKVEEQEAVVDPFEDDDDLEGMLDGDEFADLPLEVGADSDSISKYESVKERRKNRKVNESVTKETFDYKKLVRGEYK